MKARRGSHAGLPLLLATVVMCGCGVPGEPVLPIEIDVGEHAITILVPEGWQHQDRGRAHRFEQGSAYITLTDLGPATRDGLVAALRESRALYDAGQPEDARVALAEIEPRWFFTTRDRWNAVKPAWQVLTIAARDGAPPPHAIESAYRFVLAQAEALVDPDFAALAYTYLGDLGHTSQRDVEREVATAVSGRRALRIETWDRLTHLWGRKHLFVLNEGRLLCLRTELGDTAVLDPTFDELVDSMAYRDVPVSGAGS